VWKYQLIGEANAMTIPRSHYKSSPNFLIKISLIVSYKYYKLRMRAAIYFISLISPLLKHPRRCRPLSIITVLTKIINKGENNVILQYN
jgi:hypothetical protein